MNTVYLFSKACLLLFMLFFSSSCNVKNEAPKEDVSLKNVADKGNTKSYGEHDNVRDGILDSAGNLWFGTTNEGVYRYNGKSWAHFTEKDGLSSNYVNCILEDKTGTIWFGTTNGLNKFDGKTFTHVQIPWDGGTGLKEHWWSPNEIVCMLQDTDGDIWIGTGGFGAYHFDPLAPFDPGSSPFTHFSFTNDAKQSDSLHHNFIKSILEDSDGNIWFTSLTHGGVSRYDGEEITHFSAKDGLMDDMVFSSFQDKSGKLWFGSIQTKHYGLYYFDGNTFTGIGKEDGLCDNFVTGFFEDKNGLLWIRTGAVLCTYDGNSFAPFITPDGKDLSGVSFIVEDAQQNIWLGGSYGHIWKYDGETLIDFTQKGR